ncbi:hypothetical protein FF38_03978 [Lucilia cuprina]|uniref:Uncharacterized protein n=1 Tax=Lucilia cuprina TaxID=7375 RepID=A0A0L0BR68_LUCCU|nr:uncharacterized protein LOC111674498 [Lucilia cuprina]KNC21724.1 hypothetical protein FF38_03978 [Lucilia cuprina]
MKLIFIVIFMMFTKSSRALLYPASSSLGLVSSVSVPILELLPDRRCIVDWCFQMSYDLPYKLSSFYNIPIWPGKHGTKTRKRDINSFMLDPFNSWSIFEKYNTTKNQGRHPSDFTAGELYQSIEDFLVSYGYHETCLLKSVCELAKHPFAEEHRNLLTDILTFILTPSLHEGFVKSEQVYRESYEDAERSGFLGEDCTFLYPDCKRDLLSNLSKIIS